MFFFQDFKMKQISIRYDTNYNKSKLDNINYKMTEIDFPIELKKTLEDNVIFFPKEYLPCIKN